MKTSKTNHRIILSNYRTWHLDFPDVRSGATDVSNAGADSLVGDSEVAETWEIIPFCWSEAAMDSLQNDSGCFLYHPDQDFAHFCRRVEDTLGVQLDVVWIFWLELHELPRNLSAFPGFKVATISDWNLSYYNIRAAAPFFDLITADRRGTEVLRSMGVHAEFWNPYFFEEKRFAKTEEISEDHSLNKTWDITFIGRINPWIQKDRADFLRRLLRLSDQYKIKVASNIYGQEYVDTYRQSKIVFNRSIRGEANIRVFEALAGESLVFLEESNQEIRDFLEPGRECVLYNDVEFEATIMQLLENQPLLERVTAEATSKKEQFGARQGVRNFLRIVSGVLSARESAGESARESAGESVSESAGISAEESAHTDGWPKTSVNLSPVDAEYQRLLHLLLTPRRIEKGRRYVQEIQEFLNQNPQPEYLGMWLLLIHFLLPREGAYCQSPQGKQALGHAREVWRYLQNRPEGQIFNTFNYARLLQRVKAPWGEEKAVWLQLLDLLDLLGADSLQFPPWVSVGAPKKNDPDTTPNATGAEEGGFNHTAAQLTSLLPDDSARRWLGVPFFQADAAYFLELNYFAWPWQTPQGGTGARWKNYGLKAILQHIACMRLGEYSAYKQHIEEALDWFLQAGEWYERNPRTWYWAGMLSVGISTVHALKLLEQSFRLDPFYIPLWEPLLKVTLASGDRALFAEFKADMVRLESLALQCYPELGGDSWKGVVS